MPIRFVDRKASLGRVANALDPATSAIAGTHTRPPGRTGVVLTQLDAAMLAAAATFRTSANRTGMLNSLLNDALPSISGSFAAAGSPVFVPASGIAVVGSLVDGTDITFTRAAGGFGIKPFDPRPLLWMPMKTGASPSPLGRVTSARPMSQLTFSATGGADGFGCLVGDTSNGGSADNLWNMRLDSDSWAGSTYDWNSYDQKFFNSYRCFKNFGDLSVAANYNVKHQRSYARPTGGPDVGGYGFMSTYHSRSNGRFGQENMPNSPYMDYDRRGFNPAPFAAANSITNRWYHEQTLNKTNSAATNTGPITDQIYKWGADSADYVIKPPYTTYDAFYLRWHNATGDASDGRLRTTFPLHYVVDTGGGQRPSAPNGSFIVYDDVYFDDSWCRVVLTESANYLSSKILCPQPPFAWSDTVVSVRVQLQGVDGTASHAHLVTDNDTAIYLGHGATA